VLVQCHGKNSAWLGEVRPRRAIAQPDEIVIYPGGVKGNPMEARQVVRWILSDHPEQDYGSDDVVMMWNSSFRLEPRYASNVKGVLTVWRNFSEFRDLKQRRSGTCYAVRKGLGRPLNQHPADAVLIDRYNDDEQLITAFNRHKLFVCYDHVSMLPLLAALCGCVALVIPDGQRTRQELESHAGYLFNGVAWGAEDLDRAKATLPQAWPEFRAYLASVKGQVAEFVELCGERWPGRIQGEGYVK